MCFPDENYSYDDMVRIASLPQSLRRGKRFNQRFPKFLDFNPSHSSLNFCFCSYTDFIKSELTVLICF